MTEQGAHTFQVRSRTLDMQSALSQLSAAGWINAQELARAQQQNNNSSNGNSSSSSYPQKRWSFLIISSTIPRCH